MSAIVRRCRGCAREYAAEDGRGRCEDCGYELGWWCPAHEAWLTAGGDRSFLTRLHGVFFELDEGGRPACARCAEEPRLAKKRARAEARQRAREAKRRAREARRAAKAAKAAKAAPRPGGGWTKTKAAQIFGVVLVVALIGGIVTASVLLGNIADEPTPRFTAPTVVVRRDLGVDPTASVEKMRLAGQLVQARRYRDAVEAFEAALRLDPQNAWGYCGLAGALHRLRRYQEAIAAAREALRLGGDDKLLAASHFALGRSLAATRQRREAIKELRLCLKLNRRHTAARRLLARLTGRSR